MLNSPIDTEHQSRKKRPIKRFYNSCREKFRRAQYSSRGILSEEQGNEVIRDHILSGKPAAIGKIGSVECSAMVDYLKQHRSEQLKRTDWGKHGFKLYKNAGVFPQEPAIYFKFCQIYESALQEIDLVGIWYRKGELKVLKECCSTASLMNFSLLNPPFAKEIAPPWTEYLKGKTVLVIHPFAQTIGNQYSKRESIWPKNPGLLPEYTLRTLKIPMAASIAPSPYQNWVQGLEDLKSQMDAIPYDVVLVGAGAWSLPLVAHAKARGKVGIHTGGATQVFFGIKGRRWEKVSEPDYYNDAWVRPSSEETPETAHILEKACYW